jgi:plasmid replication initiation protein
MTKATTIRQDYQLVNAKYKLSTTEIKFILLSLTQIKKEDTEFQEYEIKVSELEAYLQAEQNETRLKQFAKKMMSKPLEVPTGDGWIIANWFGDVEYIRGQAKFKVSFSKKLKPYLLDLQKRFVNYNLRYIIPLTSSYSVRIYQMLKEYEKLKIRYIKVDELMDILQVPTSYKIYNRFKEKVLEIAEKELLEHTDIYFTLEEEKEGRKVDRLIFRIYPNKHKEDLKTGTLFDATPTSDYFRYYGKSVSFVNGSKKEHITLIAPMNDGSLIVKFKDNSELRFITEKALTEKIL